MKRMCQILFFIHMGAAFHGKTQNIFKKSPSLRRLFSAHKSKSLVPWIEPKSPPNLVKFICNKKHKFVLEGFTICPTYHTLFQWNLFMFFWDTNIQTNKQRNE